MEEKKKEKEEKMKEEKKKREEEAKKRKEDKEKKEKEMKEKREKEKKEKEEKLKKDKEAKEKKEKELKEKKEKEAKEKQKQKEAKEKEKEKEKEDKKKTEDKKVEKKEKKPAHDKKNTEEKKEIKKISIESKKEKDMKKHEETKKAANKKNGKEHPKKEIHKDNKKDSKEKEKKTEVKKEVKKEEKKEEKNEEKEKKKDETKEGKPRPQRRVRIKLDNLADKTPELSKNTFTFGKNVKNDESTNTETKDEDDDLFDIQEDQCVQYEGYVYKYSQSQHKIKKTYFKLVGKDLYYYKKKEEKNHRGMHNLSGVFIKRGEDFEFEGKKYFSIVILYQNEKAYYFDNENDFNIWFEKLNLAIQNKSLFDKYEVKQKIGKGKFGLVKCGINKETKKPVAIKIMAKKNMDKSDLELAKVEIDILKIGQHPNIIKLYDIYENENYIYIIMEYCSGGDLLSYFEYHEYELPETKVCEIIHKLSMAIYYLHSYGIIHRDLKPENILMTDLSMQADIRLLDFGLSKIVGNDEKCTEPYGTLSFVAPEVLQGKPYDKSVDLWSIGIITFLLLCGYLPFDDKHSEREIARQTIQDPVPYEEKIWSKYSPEAKSFVDGLLQKKPEKRYTIKEILEHPWIKKMDKVPEKRKENKSKSQFGTYTSKEE